MFIMDPTPRVRVAPTLETMETIYRLSRDGGPRSERFRAYVERVEHEWGLVAYNPMAGDAARQAVEALLRMDAESVAARAAASTIALCDFDETITLAVVVRSSGMWTDRLATEVEVRAAPVQAPRNHGIVALWSREPLHETTVARESIAEAVRVMSTSLHGSARTVAEFLHREGLAYALANATRPGDAEDSHAIAAVTDAVEILADSTTLADVAGVLFGDPACDAMGWPRLGVPANGGYAWAVERAAGQLATATPAACIRQRVFASDRSATVT
jgi:hypothetical protein